MLHCPYHLQSSGKVEKTNDILNLKLPKLSETFELPWPKICSLALKAIQATLYETYWLPLYELVTRRLHA